MSRLVGVTDKSPAAGVQEVLVSLPPETLSGAIQAIDIMPGGEPITLKAVSGSVTPLVASATVPPWDALVWQVPSGRFAVVDAAYLVNYAADETVLKLTRRYFLAGHCAQAAPSAPTAPTVATTAFSNGSPFNGTGVSYKIAHVNAIDGQESPASAASSTVSPTSAQGVNVTIPALATGGVAVAIYRSQIGAPGGPWYFLDYAAGGTTFLDLAPDAGLDTAKTPATTWGNDFTGPSAGGGCELVYENVGVALAAAPATLAYTSAKGFRSTVAHAPATTANTRVRIPLANETRGFATAGPTVHHLQRQRIADYGALQVHGYNSAKATMGGQWVIWGYQIFGTTIIEGALPIAGAKMGVKFWRPMLLPPSSVLCAQIVNTAAAAAGVREVVIHGRIFDTPV